MKFQHWQPLEVGDCIDIVAPGMKPKPNTMRGIQKFLSTWGLRARIAKDLLGQDLICSHTRDYRFSSLKSALLARDSKMVWCLRGGYGSIHLLDELNKLKPSRNKIFMGLSDSTSVHGMLNQKWGWATIHGSNIDRFARGEVKENEIKRFHRLLFGSSTSLKYRLKPMNEAADKNRKIVSTIVGGNMITLQSDLGTRYQINPKGKILFFEDIGERAYRIDRVLVHMERLGVFKGVKAILLGQFTGGHEPTGRSLVPRLLKQFAQTRDIPVFAGIESGHGPVQFPLPFNTRTVLVGGPKPHIEIHTGAIEP